jgi:hypothetical protein
VLSSKGRDASGLASSTRSRRSSKGRKAGEVVSAGYVAIVSRYHSLFLCYAFTTALCSLLPCVTLFYLS